MSDLSLSDTDTGYNEEVTPEIMLLHLNATLHLELHVLFPNKFLDPEYSFAPQPFFSVQCYRNNSLSMFINKFCFFFLFVIEIPLTCFQNCKIL